jgi:hypothetical protein
MITKEKWIEFLDNHYKLLNIEKDEDLAAFCMLATVEEFLRINGEI